MGTESEVGGARSWDPTQYERYREERMRPALDLLARIPPLDPGTIVDLGCGTGAATRLLAERWPRARVVGIDRSPEMLARAAADDARHAVEWQASAIEDWRPRAPVDLVFSNAALHWLPDHEQLFPRLLTTLAPGGVLAVQMPASWRLPSHRLMRETLADGGAGGIPLGPPELRERLARPPVASVETYHDLLASPTTSVEVWETEYEQLLSGPDAVLEWVRGTGLRPILQALADGERERFLALYRERLARAYPARPDGRTPYPFPRLFFVARALRRWGSPTPLV